MAWQDRLADLLTVCVDTGAWAGGVLGVVPREGPACIIPHGMHLFGAGRIVRADALFDLASLTKVVGTTAVAMRYVDAGLLSLDEPVSERLPEFAVSGPAERGDRRSVTVRHLLAHASGLPAYVPFHREPGVRGSSGRALILSVPLETQPGTQTVYSDVGFLTLGFLLEQVGNAPLQRLVETAVTEPLGMQWTRFLPPVTWRSRILPTEVPTGGGAPLHGRVHDENARWLGGVAGHAGLFSSVDDLCSFARMLLHQGTVSGVQYVSAETVCTFTKPAGIVPGSSRCLGWDSPTAGCSGGKWLRPGSFGHTGFTGTSIWVDPACELGIILLTNAVHPRRESRVERGSFSRRREVHEAVYDSLGLTSG